MVIKKCYLLCLFLIVLSSKGIYSQSLGVVYEGSSFNLNNLFYHNGYSLSGMIKNLYVNFNTKISNDFIASTRIGYGWDNHKSVNTSEGVESFSEENINGFPVEAEIKYKHLLTSDSIFEPIVGLGFGYYNYTTTRKNESSNEMELITKGFGQYLTFGCNIHISKSLFSCIQFKKMMLNSITTKYEEGDTILEKDFVQESGMNNLAISIGLFFSLSADK